MSVMKASELVRRHIDIAKNYQTVYMWGCFGMPVTESIIREKAAQYPSWYTAAKQSELRKQSVFADYFLGSVHAITEDGQLVVASGSGSQLPAYIYTSDHIIWVAGTHKIVPTLDAGFQRVAEHSYPMEDQRQKSLGNSGSTIGKILVFEKEINPARQLTLVLVNEVLGF